MSINVTLFGHLGSDPEMKQVNNTDLATASVAVRHDRKDRDGNYKTDWYRLNVWGGQANFFASNFIKGSRIMATGTLEINSYTTNSGEERETKDIRVDSLKIIDWLEDNQQAPARKANYPAEEIPLDDISDDDFPF